MVRALGLFSGGLDSMLAVRLLQEQAIEVTGVAGMEDIETTVCKYNSFPFRFQTINRLLHARKVFYLGAI